MAELLREQVDAYLQPIFAKYQFQYSGELAKKMKRSGPVPKPAKLFLSEDPRIPQYYEECDAEHRRQGYVDLPKDHCPALTAKSLQIQAEEALMASANQVFGLKRSPYMPDARAKYLDLLMTACLSSNSKPREIQ
jgi:hypothetical protein